jgi:hypothetical protein
MKEGAIGTTKPSRTSRNVVNAAIILIFIAAIFGPTLLRDQKYRSEGVVTQGIVEGKSSPRARKGSDRFYVWYSFSVDGRVINRDREAISQELWRPLKQFGPVDVTYLPSNPLLFLAMALVAVFVVILGVCQGIWSRRNRTLD